MGIGKLIASLSFLVASGILPSAGAQAPKEISAETAAAHLIRKVEPIYPPFAKAAGLEGVVYLRVAIEADGRVDPSSLTHQGPVFLAAAARNAVSQYVYRPFEEGVVIASVEVDFKLDNGQTPRTYTPPVFGNNDISGLVNAGGFAPSSRSPILQTWIRRKLESYGPGLSGEELAVRTDTLLAGTRFIPIPAGAGKELYLITTNAPEQCSNTGNAPVKLVEVLGHQIHLITEDCSSGFYAYPRSGSDYPDVFLTGWVSEHFEGVFGYSNFGGTWGRLYCGGISIGEGQQESFDVHQCR